MPPRGHSTAGDKARRAAEVYLDAEQSGDKLEVRDVAARFGLVPRTVSMAVKALRDERAARTAP